MIGQQLEAGPDRAVSAANIPASCGRREKGRQRAPDFSAPRLSAPALAAAAARHLPPGPRGCIFWTGIRGKGSWPAVPGLTSSPCR